MVGGIYNFVAGDRFFNPGTNPAFPTGGFSIWTGLQGSEVVGVAMVASNADTAALNDRNAQANQIIRVVRMVLRVIVRPLTMQQGVGICCYLLHCLLGPQCPLIGALQLQVGDALYKDFASFSL